MVGNLVVERDEVFGGGHLKASGPVTPTQDFEFILDDKIFKVLSAADVSITAGRSDEANSGGSDVHVRVVMERIHTVVPVVLFRLLVAAVTVLQLTAATSVTVAKSR